MSSFPLILLDPVTQAENGTGSFHYNYFEDAYREEVVCDPKEAVLYREKGGGREFSNVLHAAMSLFDVIPRMQDMRSDGSTICSMKNMHWKMESRFRPWKPPIFYGLTTILHIFLIQKPCRESVIIPWQTRIGCISGEKARRKSPLTRTWISG